MKFIIRISILAVIIIAAISCKSYKNSASKTEAHSEEIYEKSINALEEHNFIIEPRSELMLAHTGRNNSILQPAYSNIVSVSGNFISLKGSVGVINFNESLFPDIPVNKLQFVDNNAVMFKERNRGKSEISYFLKIKDDNDEMNKRDIIIILYENSNECFVKVYDGRTGDMHISFKGLVLQENIEK